MREQRRLQPSREDASTVLGQARIPTTQQHQKASAPRLPSGAFQTGKRVKRGKQPTHSTGPPSASQPATSSATPKGRLMPTSPSSSSPNRSARSHKLCRAGAKSKQISNQI